MLRYLFYYALLDVVVAFSSPLSLIPLRYPCYLPKDDKTMAPMVATYPMPGRENDDDDDDGKGNQSDSITSFFSNMLVISQFLIKGFITTF